MARRDVADFMGKHAGNFGLVFRQGQQTSGYVDITAREGKSVDDGRVQHREAELQVRQLRGLGEK